MSLINSRVAWEDYREKELAVLTPLLQTLGFSLEEKQPHLVGERYLMQALTSVSGKKLILIGRRLSDDIRVIIKATDNLAGKAELIHERTCREVLQKIGFAYETFHLPEEILCKEVAGRLIVITEFIEQPVSFLQRPLKEQFEFALAAFKAQESAHATTLNHMRLVEKTFGSMNAHNYLDSFRGFKKKLQAHHPPDSLLIDLCTRAIALLESHLDVIEQYAGFLTHVDFVPHNMRINDGTIYLLDHSALRFGNKYEGWARFINFMTLYNPPLAQALIQYVRDNRTPEELLSLNLMRMYRLGEIMLYYQNTLDKSEGNLHALNTARLHFWSKVFEAVLAEENLSESIRTNYIAVRDSLRSADEKERQVGLH